MVFQRLIFSEKTLKALAPGLPTVFLANEQFGSPTPWLINKMNCQQYGLRTVWLIICMAYQRYELLTIWLTNSTAHAQYVLSAVPLTKGMI